MKSDLETKVAEAVKELFGQDVAVELTRPEEQFGDYATNVALQLAKPVGKSPREIAEALAEKLQDLGEVSVAGPGFINIRLKDPQLAQTLQADLPKPLVGQEILVEFGDPNPFKEMHIGHVYSYIVGDAISRLLEANGAKVRRLSYHGDVGLHVAKAIYGMQKEGVRAENLIDHIKANIGLYYARGAQDYEDDDQAREAIQRINEHVYRKDDPEINQLYEWGRERSFGYFEQILDDLEIKSDKQYFESETAEIGADLVRRNTGKVFQESDGAIVYDGESKGLHTRVFITSKGLPTYETKDLGLAELKRRDYPEANRSIIITANEQSEYFKVMLAALSDFDPELAKSIAHLSHGFVSLSTGKMSSRTGEVYSGVAAITDVDNEIKKLYPAASLETRNAAIKYHFIKHRLGSNIVYDLEESFSIEGNSGPYLQYAQARARSILAKAGGVGELGSEFDAGERSLARKISEYPEVVDRAVAELMPHHIAGYLYELAQSFNKFYEQNRVIGDEREAVRLALVTKYADTLKNGFSLLGIAAPDRM